MTREELSTALDDVARGIAEACREHVDAVERRIVERIERLERGVTPDALAAALQRAQERSR